ncbi:bifunctional UDP-2,4-diacetamido-2,4,6-trideoxy-beta-L-altropyranose hydrolase/GNAT family N-acetyltransferase [Schumannella soli]|uniref:UDP-2,4-diacetamido-2,4, 6-trideoxy-beta-L-altropyranose hydrolase n=1 Tax=Schumannella soli TaxID=2590779 RepID=A0A506Y3U6_9MICO|nr:bifunctional UDP-2,4-diacetamido-2,4,6-trideoxy-beta-L-altropyranose hydrolase/GNAT family N-acetyltransferase [Schumannella soli]TPW77246.1 UDP-2,4-diacetamido-2,4,6-trideoxy-beta-L-altropyranose hydrolase [Schumannella soli]
MRVLLRADGTARGGVGHISRVAAVAEAAIELGWTVGFSGRLDTPLARELLSAPEIERMESADSGAALAAAATEFGATVVHVDDYVLGRDLRGELTRRGVLLSSIEDGPFGRRPADLVVEPSPPAFADHRPDDGSFRIVGGAEFVPLRREVLTGRVVEPGEEAPIVVSMGGTDAFGVSGACLELIARVDVRRPVLMVASDPPSLPRGLEVRVVAPSPALARIFSGAALVVTGSGTTMWELAANRIPAAAVLLTENQRLNYEWATTHGVAAGLGAIPDLGTPAAERRLAEALAAADRQAVSGISAGHLPDPIVGLDGARHIVETWSEIADAPDRISVRPAVAGDAGRLLDWRNDPVSRAMSRTAGELAWNDHRAWVHRALRDPDRSLLIAELGRQAIGTLRFDRLDDIRYEVSIALAPSARGRGFASAALEAAIATLPSGSEIIAEVDQRNAASRALFAKARFVDAGEASTPGFIRLRRSR